MWRPLCSVLIALLLAAVFAGALWFVERSVLLFSSGEHWILAIMYAVLFALAVFLGWRTRRIAIALLGIGFLARFVFQLFPAVRIHSMLSGAEPMMSFTTPTWILCFQWLLICLPIGAFWIVFEKSQCHLTRR